MLSTAHERVMTQFGAMPRLLAITDGEPVELSTAIEQAIREFGSTPRLSSGRLIHRIILDWY